ncbi:MAG: hypothetical protein JSW07_15390, partial [bacterium]
MLKKLTAFLIVFCCCTSMVLAQTMKVEPFGISPRDASTDEGDIFDRAYNGLLNVGVETQMYLKGTLSGASLSSPSWSVTSAPTGSAADITTAVDVDTSTQIAVFTPDVVGTYVVEFADGGNSTSVTINAATYVGIEDGVCTPCHNNAAYDFKTTKWQGTGHYSLMENEINGSGDHYSERCIGCHTTGYDVNANNGGFDDREFVFPDSASLVNDYGSPDGYFFDGVWDQMLGFFPDAMKLARIQCESCHGPGSAHMGITSDSKMVSSLSSDNCAWCHDSGTHHVYPEQWDASQHAKYEHPYTRSSCAPCHNGAGFVEFVKGGKVGLSEDMAENVAITCATCHEPHSDANAHQIRTVDAVELPSGDILDGGNGNLCMNCHNSRRNALERAAGSRPTPHHGPQGEVLFGVNIPTFGKKLPSSAHMRIENTCIACHMHAELDEEGEPIKAVAGQIVKVGQHSFNMVSPEGVDNVGSCEKCHAAFGESFAEKKFYWNGNADHDGDGDEEGLQHEVEGLLHDLALLLHPVGIDSVEDRDSNYEYTLTEKYAIYNYFLIEEDRSMGIHNPAFTVALLKVSIQAVKNHALDGSIVEIADVPNDQGKQVRIIWNKFADDGIAIDP